jgi:urease accessory protein
MAGIVAGLVHPVSTPAHVVALIGLGLMAGRNFRRTGAAIIGAFALGLTAGLCAIASGVGETPASDVLLATATLYGLVAASGLTAPVSLAVPAALVSGIALGLDSPPESILLGEAIAMLIGTACGGIGALAMIAFLVSGIARWRQGILLRVAGSWIAAIAIMVLALRWATPSQAATWCDPWLATVPRQQEGAFPCPSYAPARWRRA